MKETRILMGMPITIEIAEEKASRQDIDQIFSYFSSIDQTFSTYKVTSEISQINRGVHPREAWSENMVAVMEACEKTKSETNGYFDISHNGYLDPSGYVKGWAISQAANLLTAMGYAHFYVEAGGDLQLRGQNGEHRPWTIGIRNPFNINEVIKRVSLSNMGMATSGTYVRGQHIYNPHLSQAPTRTIVSLTVLGLDIVDADRFATAAFAMGEDGIAFIASLGGFEAYMIDTNGIATFTEGFTHYIAP